MRSLVILLVAATTFAAFEPAPVRASTTSTVTMQNLAFSPSSITITAGDSVVWHNAEASASAIQHTATSTGSPKVFDTGLVDPGASSAAVPFPDPGTFSYQCDVHPTMKGSVTVRAAATTPPPSSGGTSNQPPTADFSWSPVSPVANTSVAFADASSDPDGTLASWKWAFGDGATSSDTNPAHVFAAKGSYTVTLSVTDNAGARSVVASKTLRVATIPPIANFSYAPAFPLPGEDVEFTDASRDVDGTVVQRVWELGDGTRATTANATHAYATRGDRTVNLTVTDDDGATSRVWLIVAVRDPPVAAFTALVDGLNVTVDANDSRADDGVIVERAWLWPDGVTTRGATSAYTFHGPGTYPVTLTVRDARGHTGSVTRNVTADARAPVALFTMTPSDPLPGDVVSFRDVSRATQGTIASRAWDLGDGATSTRESPTHAYGAGGTYVVTLNVTDSFGTSAIATRTLHVARPPIARIALAATGLTLRADASASSAPDGGALAYRWDWGDVTAGSLDGVTAHAYEREGPYVVTLTVTDARGLANATSQIVRLVARPMNVTLEGGTAPALVGVPLAFAARVDDPDSPPISWFWDFGDGARSEAPLATHAFASAGDHTVHLAVRDAAGRSQVASRVVRVEEPAWNSAAPQPRTTGGAPGIDAAASPEATVPRAGAAPNAPSPVHEKQLPAPGVGSMFALVIAAAIGRRRCASGAHEINK